MRTAVLEPQTRAAVLPLSSLRPGLVVSTVAVRASRAGAALGAAGALLGMLAALLSPGGPWGWLVLASTAGAAAGAAGMRLLAPRVVAWDVPVAVSAGRAQLHDVHWDGPGSAALLRLRSTRTSVVDAAGHDTRITSPYLIPVLIPAAAVDAAPFLREALSSPRAGQRWSVHRWSSGRGEILQVGTGDGTITVLPPVRAPRSSAH